MKLLLICLLTLCLVYFSYSLNVKLSHSIKGKAPNKTLELNCSINYNKNEAFSNVTFTKDKIQFLYLDKSNASIINKTHIKDLKNISPLVQGNTTEITGINLKLANISNTAYGEYKCTVYSNITHASDSVKVNGSQDLALKTPILAFALIIFSVFKL